MAQILWFTQVEKDGIGSHDIVTIEAEGNAWERIQRMPFRYKGNPDGLQPYDVLIDLLDDEENLISDNPLVIDPRKAQWLLGTFYSVDRKYVNLIKTPHSFDDHAIYNKEAE